MPLINQTIPNLINGVSQQPASLRLPTQHESQVNCFPSVVEGLKHRPPTEHIAKLMSGSLGSAFVHKINRDVTERYFVIVRQNSIRVFDINGVEKSVNTPDGTAYLNEADPKTAFWAVTVADYSFILNMNKTVAMESTLSPSRTSEGLIFVRRGEYGTKYSVYIDGVEVANKTTSTTDALDLDTTTIASSLYTSLSALSGYTATKSGSVIHIVKNDNTAFVLKCEDGHGNDALQSIRNKVQKFSDLPGVAPDGFMVEVDADPESDAESYFVKFEVNSAGQTFGEGTWKETVKQGIKYKLDAATMPHVLVRESDGTFTFKKQTWQDRTAGDEDTAKQPSFVGSKINDIFFYKNRLSFLSDENIIMSEVGEYFNFFPVTVTQTLDSDPIDSTASHTKVSILRHAVPFSSNVILFSDQTQFKLSGGETGLTFKTIQVNQTTEFETSLRTKPIGVGKSIYFVTNKGDYHGVREFFVDTDADVNDAADVTGHVPTYIPAGMFKLAASTIEDMIVGFTSGYKNGFFFYKFYWDGNTKVQSAWFKCEVGAAENTEVVFGDFIETTLYLIIQRSDGVYLEKMRLEPGRVDPFVQYVTHLDRRITEASCTSRTYDAVSDTTTLTLPYTINAPMNVATRADSDTPSEPPGRAATIISQTGTALVVQGDWSAKTLWIGQKITAVVDLSKFYLRRASPSGGQIVETSGRLQLRKMTVLYSNSAYFKFQVKVVGRDVSEYVFNGRIVGDASNVIGTVSLVSGEFSVPILSKNENVQITFTSDSFLPFRLISLKWEALYVTKSQAV